MPAAPVASNTITGATGSVSAPSLLSVTPSFWAAAFTGARPACAGAIWTLAPSRSSAASAWTVAVAAASAASSAVTPASGCAA